MLQADSTAANAANVLVRVKQRFLMFVEWRRGGFKGLGCSFLFVLFLSISAAGSQQRHDGVPFSPLPETAIVIAVISVLVIVTGIIGANITSSTYKRTLKQYKDTIDAQALANELADIVLDTDSSLRTVAFDVISDVCDTNVRKKLSSSLLSSENVGLRFKSLKTIVALRTDNYLPALIRALRDREGAVRDYAVGVLRDLKWTPINDDDRVYFLIATKNWSELQELGELTIEPLIWLLADEIESNRVNAIAVLTQIGNEDTLSVLNPLTKDKHKDVRQAAVKAVMAIERRSGERSKLIS